MFILYLDCIDKINRLVWVSGFRICLKAQILKVVNLKLNTYLYRVIFGVSAKIVIINEEDI